MAAAATIKEEGGKAIGDRNLEGEGKAEKAEGHIHSGVGKAMARGTGGHQREKD